MSNIGMIVAVEDGTLLKNWENKTLLGTSPFSVFSMPVGTGEVVTAICGAGVIKAAAATQHLIDKYDVKAVVNYGVTGGCSDEVNSEGMYLVGGVIHYDHDVSGVDSVLPAQYVEYTGRTIRTDENLIKTIKEAVPEIGFVKCACGDRFLEAEQKKLCKKIYNTDICDMESAGILITCHRNHVPCALIKTVADTSGGGGDEYWKRKEISIQKNMDQIRRAIAAVMDIYSNQNAGMKKIASFSIDHDVLKEGIYLSRNDDGIMTWDIRMKRPNSGDYLSTSIAHTLEHLFATYVRNSGFKPHIIYVGPMGCRTGFYLITKGMSNAAVLKCVIDSFAFIAEYNGEIPGAKSKECGNYRDHDLEGARKEAASYLTIIRNLSPKNMAYKTRPGVR